MSIWGKLFGADKAVDNIVDKDNGLLVRAGTAIGNLHYSEQEKAENSLLVRQWGINQLEALHPFKVVQRILAFSVMFGWLFVLINLVAMFWLEHPSSGKLLELAFSDYVFWPVLSVLSLYMSGGVLTHFGNKKSRD